MTSPFSMFFKKQPEIIPEKKRVLIIEDDNEIANIFETALADKFIIKTQTNVKNLLTAFDGFLPQLIMIDNYFGGIRSAKFIKEIRSIEAYCEIPIILFSGQNDKGYQQSRTYTIGLLPTLSSAKDLLNHIEMGLKINGPVVFNYGNRWLKCNSPVPVGI